MDTALNEEKSKYNSMIKKTPTKIQQIEKTLKIQ